MTSREIFISIREKFIKLLKEGNNSYKYVRQHREQINKYIKDDDENGIFKYKHAISACDEIDATILKQLLYMLSVIFTEKGKCRYHTNDDIAAKIEKDIITDALPILKEAKYKNQKIVEINEIIAKADPCAKEIDELYFSMFERKYGYPANINTSKITEITDQNIEDIHTNFSSVKRLLDPTESLNQKHKEIDDYLFCLYYFKG